jgi:hypothetical protein
VRRKKEDEILLSDWWWLKRDDRYLHTGLGELKRDKTEKTT